MAIRYRVPPNALIHLVKVHKPGEWEAYGRRPRRRCVEVEISYLVINEEFEVRFAYFGFSPPLALEAGQGRHSFYLFILVVVIVRTLALAHSTEDVEAGILSSSSALLVRSGHRWLRATARSQRDRRGRRTKK